MRRENSERVLTKKRFAEVFEKYCTAYKSDLDGHVMWNKDGYTYYKN